MLTSNVEELDDIQGRQKINEFGWFFKYVIISTTLFNILLIGCEVFSFQNFTLTVLRILGSTLGSVGFIMLYYFLALKKKMD